MVRRLGLVLLFVGVLSLTPGSTALAQRPAGDAASFAAYLSTGYRVTPNVTYMTASGIELKLDFYRPAQASGPLPTAIFMHGGGYRVTSRKEASSLSVIIPGGRHGNFERDQVLRAWTAIEAFLAKNVISKAVTTSAVR